MLLESIIFLFLPFVNYLLPIYIFLSIILYFIFQILIGLIFYKIFGPIKEGVFKLNSKEAFVWMVTHIFLRTFFVLKNLGIPLSIFSGFFSKVFKTNIRPSLCEGFVEYPLVEIGENTIVGKDAEILGHAIENGKLIIKRVKIGKNVTIGAKAFIMPGVEIGDDVIVGACSLVPKNKKLEKNSIYVGVPTRKIGNI